MKKIILLVFIALLTGCNGTIQSMRDNDLSSGCTVINANARLGYFNQEGQADACKLKCSETLPPVFNYSFDNGLCKVSIGSESLHHN